MGENVKNYRKSWSEMRRGLHQIPELGGELPKTRAYVEEKLKELGIPFVENKTDSGLIATIKEGRKKRERPFITPMQIWMPFRYRKPMRLDYISRHEEGCMHACGHDTHMTIAAGGG